MIGTAEYRKELLAALKAARKVADDAANKVTQLEQDAANAFARFQPGDRVRDLSRFRNNGKIFEITRIVPGYSDDEPNYRGCRVLKGGGVHKTEVRIYGSDLEKVQ